MALVHDKLYRKVESETLDLGDYIESLVHLLVPTEVGDEDAVKVSVKVEAVEKPVKLCLDVGIVVT